MREVFKIDPNAAKPDPGRVYYTITRYDIGARFIRTTIGIISLGYVIGHVQKGDVGKQTAQSPGWHWPAGKTFGELASADRRTATRQAAARLQDELARHAQAITAIMEGNG